MSKMSIYKVLFFISILGMTSGAIAQTGWVGGKVFHDNNENCSFNSNEEGLSFRMVKISLPNGSNPQYTMTDSLGNYSFRIPIRMLHMITLLRDTNDYRHYYTQNKCIQNATFYVASDTAPKNFYHIPQTIFPNRTDIKVTTSAPYGWNALNSSIDRYTIHLKNLGSEAIDSFSVKFEIPTGTQHYRSVPAPSRSVGNTLYWDINQTIHIREEKQIFVDVRIPSTVLPGSMVQFEAATQNLTDIYPSDNKSNVVQSVTNNISPTFKSVNPTYISPSTSRINYFIRFQNKTGFTVSNVSVIDTLDTNLPLTDIRIGSSSHPFQFSVLGNVLRWDFSNIVLPDSSNDPTLSQGYLYFSAGVRQGLRYGDSIENTAYVQFNGGIPNATNSVVVKMVANNVIPTMLDRSNFVLTHSGSSYSLENRSNEIREFEIIDLSGRIIQTFQIFPGNTFNFQLSSSNNLHLLRSLDGSFMQKLITNP
ncbi:MAG: hypothetical protein RIS99_1252 [Bacteroidota bacterium]